MKRHRKHEFAGQEQGERLCNWLNAVPPDDARRRRIEHIMGKYRDLVTNAPAIASNRLFSAFYRGAFGDELRPYQGSLEPTGVSVDGHVAHVFRAARNSAIDKDEFAAFVACYELARDGRVENIRRCEGSLSSERREPCNKWIFVKWPRGKRPQRCCAVGDCRQNLKKIEDREYQAYKRLDRPKKRRR